jgi:2Fe-2S ferredoxin
MNNQYPKGDSLHVSWFIPGRKPGNMQAVPGKGDAAAARMEVVPKVTFSNLNKTVEFESGKLPYDEHGKPESILDVAMNSGIQLEHACGGVCACTTCHVIVKSGDGNLSEAQEDELDKLDFAPGLTPHSRLACQAVVKGDVIVEIPSWNRNSVSEGGGSLNLGDAIPPPKTAATSVTE